MDEADIPAMVNENGTPLTQPETQQKVGMKQTSNIPTVSMATLTPNTTVVTNGDTHSTVSNATTKTTSSTGTTNSSDSITADIVTSCPVSDFTNTVSSGSSPILAKASTAGNTSQSVVSTSVPSTGDVVTLIEQSPVKIKTEVMDEEFNSNDWNKNLMENIDWFLDQVADGYKECEVHRLDMLEQNIVCLTCQKFMCALCLRDYHLGHDIISITKLRECRNVRKELEDDVSTLQLMQQALKTELDDKQKLKKEVEQSAESLREKVDTAFDQLMTIIESKRNEIKKHINDFEKQNQTELGKDLDRIKAIEQSATVMIHRVMVFFTKFDIAEARILPTRLSEMISKCKEFRVDHRSGHHKDKLLPEKKFSNILPSLLAVANICKSIHPEATKVVWSKITPDKRSSDTDTHSKPVRENTKDPTVLLASLPENSRSSTPMDMDVMEETEVSIPKPKKNTPGSKHNSDSSVPRDGLSKNSRCASDSDTDSAEEMDVGSPKLKKSTQGCKRNADLGSVIRTSIKDMGSTNHPLQKTKDFDDCWYKSHKKNHATPTGRGKKVEKRKEKLSPSNVHRSSKPSKKARISSESPSTSLSTMSTHSSTESIASSSSSTSSAPTVSSTTSNLPVITSVISLADKNKNTPEKTSSNSKSGLFSIDFGSVGASQESPKKDRDWQKVMENKKVMAVVPSVKSLNNTKPLRGRPRLSQSSSSSVESTTLVSLVATPVSNSRVSVSQTVASTSSSRVAGPSSRGSPASTSASSSVENRTPSEENASVTFGVDGLPSLSLVNFYPQTMTERRIVMVRALKNKIWLGQVTTIKDLKSSSKFCVQWLNGQFGVDTKFEIQEKWQKKSDEIHTDCVICHFAYTLRQVMSDELVKQLKIASKQPPCSEKPRSNPPPSPRSSRDNRNTMATRRGTPPSKSNKSKQ